MDKKIAVVTGGASGIGKAIAIKLAMQDICVVLCDVQKNKADVCAANLIKQGKSAYAYELDVTNRRQIQAVIADIYESLGPISYWVNCAGVSYIRPFFEQDDALWDKTMEINLKSQYLCCQEILSHMLMHKKGSIVNLSSEAGKAGSDSYQAYCASKFGVIGLTQSLAKEFGPYGIRVNAVCPGIIATPMWDQQKADYARKRDIPVDSVMTRFQSRIPLRRIGTPEDVANLVSFLLSEEASFITGQAININGGDYME